MSPSNEDSAAPEGYVRLEGSERRPAKQATLIGPVEESETFSVTIQLRRRVDGPPLPDFDYFVKTPPPQRKGLDRDEFAAAYGAHPDEVEQVVAFAEGHGLKVTKTSIARRTVVVSGSASQFSSAFGVTFGRYEEPPERHHPRKPPSPRARSYRGRDGFVYVPEELGDAIVGVFGLDNRHVGHRSNNPGDPPIVNTLTVAQVAQLYNFPSPGPAIGEQTIGIIAPTGGYGGYLQSDIDQTFGAIGLAAPQVIPISVDSVANGTAVASTSTAAAVGAKALTFASSPGVPDGSVGQYTLAGTTYYFLVTAVAGATLTIEAADPNTEQLVSTGLFTAVAAGTTVYFNLDGETNQDICISASAAPGANLAVYFTDDTQAGWIDLIHRVLEPESGDFPPGVTPPSVLSASWSIAPGDDPDGLAYADSIWKTGVTVNALEAMTAAFQDAAILQNGPTICIASGDLGSNCGVGRMASTSATTFAGDGYAHVVYPASDPWVLSIGGTTIGQYQLPGSNTLGWVEYAWNDPFPDPFYPWGTGGGGVSDFFPLPSYQDQAGVPQSINPGITPNPADVTVTPPAPFNAAGRGVPDVASNASIYSGFSGFYLGGALSGNPGNGTSASAPLWAGLIALLNANAGFNIGFANPTFYAFGPGVFNPINPLWPDPAYPQLAACPADNANNGIPGYPATAGWDACTGLGSPNGMALLSALEQLKSVYILGGYQSPDVVITDLSTNTPVPIGGAPGGPWDTLLEPSTDYGFSAHVHNDSPATVNDVLVSFWAIPGGVGTSGAMVGTPQTVSIPAHSTVTVNASAPFHSAPTGEHLCAVVSIYSPTTGCDVDATNALEIPDPGYSMTHGCSAWRNTDSMFAFPGGLFKLHLGFGKLRARLIEPILLRIHPVHVPVDWQGAARARAVEDVLQAVGATGNMPLYLLPEFTRTFGAPHLKPKVEVTRGVKIEERGSGVWAVLPHAGEDAPAIEITARVPTETKPGDVILLNISAEYPKIEHRPRRSVEFLEFIHVRDERHRP